MSAKEKIIKFMEKKAERIKDKWGYDFYFNKKDKKEIKEWDNELAERVWGVLVHNIMENDACCLSNSTCPFCILAELICTNCSFTERCFACGYGLRHGYCADSHSDFAKIAQFHYTCNIFSNEWYRKVIKEIESQNK
ncbi:hypothetical protein DRN34_00300 [Thermococci archaeon]|nr:MAG: hypothetical protein DRN34_00300 [Thermococci archaeon]